MSLTLAAICFFGGILSGAAGFGALIIMVPALILVLGMNTTIPLGVFCGVATQSFNAIAYRAHVKKGALARMLLGSLPGIWLGSSLLLYLPEYLLRAALGMLILVYVLWSVFGKAPRPDHPPATFWIYAAGFSSGAFGGAFGINGPPAIVYLTRTGWPPDAIRAFIGMFCALLFIFTAIVMMARGLVTAEIWRLTALAVPCCLAGSFCGRRITARLRPEQYMRLIFAVLFAMGLSLCWPAFRTYILSV